MAKVYVFRVGPFDDGTSMYVPIGADIETGRPTDLDPVDADDDLTGLQRILAQDPKEELICSLELAAAARTLGLGVEELPAGFEGTRIQLAMDHAQNGDLEQIESPRSQLRLMTAIRGFLESRVAERWPAHQAFEIELQGDRSERYSGFIGHPPDPTVTLVRLADDAKGLASASSGEREKRLTSLDHLSMRLETPPSYALDPIRAFYGISVMPRFEKAQEGQRVLATDEDALVLAGVLAALSVVEQIDKVAQADTQTPGRNVRTLVAATAPSPAVDLP
jgi:hypothetical protein